jgi:hypothetical protein
MGIIIMGMITPMRMIIIMDMGITTIMITGMIMIIHMIMGTRTAIRMIAAGTPSGDPDAS